MRILVVGTGGVGSAFARIAQRRDFFDGCALADYDPARPQALVAALDDGRFSAHAIDASSRDAIVAADPRDERRRGAEQRRPGLQRADLRRLLRSGRHLPRHGDDAVGAAPDEARTRRPASSSATTSSSGRRRGRTRACSRSSASGSSRAPPTSSPATPPTSCSRRSTRSGSATAPTSSSRATTSRRPSPSGRRSRSASTRP